ncbi:MAG: FAD/NAD(P)-binding protein [Pseudomonadota bacterium]|nr:FAD/NAD(P)-binding protein [Pseudomonadota bacterium]
MKSDASRRAIIVGGGYSGTMAAAELARRGIASLLIEGGGRAGRGTAYSTIEPAHLLNVPAAKMSAWANAPDDFVDQGHQPGEFVQRLKFGTYLKAILDEAVAGGHVEIAKACAVAAEPRGDGWLVTLDDGRQVEAAALVLAIGNQPPEPMAVGDRVSIERFVNNPWREEAAAAVARLAEQGGGALILGTGLTMVDMVLSLDEAGHKGRILALSRRGQIPRAHAAYEPVPAELDEVPLGNVLALWRWLRRRSAGVGWRAAVDALRPHSHAIWRGLDDVQQRRFLRHARPWWDVHRHRIAPQVAERLRVMVADGRLEILAGRVSRMSEERNGLVVEICRRGRPSTASGTNGSKSQQTFAAAFNCTGPLGSMVRTRDPLLRRMIDDRLIAVDRLGMGIEVDESSRAAPRVWALGPLTKGAYWEVVAVPDIRGQVRDVADAIAKELQA